MMGFLRNWTLPFVNPKQLSSLALLPRFFLDFGRYRRMAPGERVRWKDTFPCLSDELPQTPLDPHYFYQGAWLARRLAGMPPRNHVDVGSSVMMVSVLSAIVPMTFVDYRPLRAELQGVRSIAGSLTALPFEDTSIESLSCLHVIEHVGLGRYGDELNPQGSRLAAAELARVLSHGGKLYLSVPVGRARVCFNAHRVFAPETIVSMFTGCELATFSLVDDEGNFLENAPLAAASSLSYGCGMFEFRKHA
jgi:SAM-dependent methyltransferase